MHKYQIIDVIDQGAYGIVWKALNKQTNTLVAIKEFKEGDEDELTRRTIQREIKMLKMLKSDYVVGIKQAFKKRGKVFLIFEYFQKNLLNVIQRDKNGLEPTLINQLVYKTIKCLQYLHSKSIIHRDIKPENILLNADYSVLKICDFGFARFLPERQYDMTDYVATRWYRSPQLLVGEPYGRPADMWAVGCMIGQMIDGQPMFPGDDQIDQICSIKNGVGDLTDKQTEYFKNNPKFANMSLPQVKKSRTIQARYLGKIQKHALSFMKLCLKINASERITVEQALKHPYLINQSLLDKQLSNDEQNLLNTERSNIHVKNESKASLFSIKDEEKVAPVKAKIISNKLGLKFQGGSVGEKQFNHVNQNERVQIEAFFKKKSHTNLNGLKDTGGFAQKVKIKKLSKIMSEEKNIKVNVDFNVKINLKINQKHDRKDLKDPIQSKLNVNQAKNHIFPQINNSNKGLRYQLNIRHQKIKHISVIGESKELIRGSKQNLLN